MASLPAVSDAQKQLLGGGYTRDGFSFSRAHPFFWAAFVYVGD
jgi:CHAT domain-containing protein